MHKNPQRRKIIHGIFPVGLKEQSIDLKIFTGAQPKAGTGLKMQTICFFNVTLLGIYIYRWLRYIAGSLKSYPPFWKERGMEDSQEKDYSFLGNDTFPNLYDALVYERKFKSEYFGETNLRAIT